MSNSRKINAMNFFLVTIILVVICYYIFFVNNNIDIKILAVILLMIFSPYYIIKIKNIKSIKGTEKSDITKLVLIDDSQEYKNEWVISDKTSLLIGKNMENNDVDIDLSDTVTEHLVSKMHAVMNFAANTWFLEDLGSDHGIGIKRLNGDFRKRIKIDTPYKLNKGDIIYIANIKLLIK